MASILRTNRRLVFIFALVIFLACFVSMGAGKVAKGKAAAVVEEEEDMYDEAEENRLMKEFEDEEDEEDEDEDFEDWDEEDLDADEDEEGESRGLAEEDLDGLIDKEDLMRQLEAMGLSMEVRLF
jgi:hypothetical protein